jgi:hypothetical protein
MLRWPRDAERSSLGQVGSVESAKVHRTANDRLAETVPENKAAESVGRFRRRHAPRLAAPPTGHGFSGSGVAFQIVNLSPVRLASKWPFGLKTTRSNLPALRVSNSWGSGHPTP